MPETMSAHGYAGTASHAAPPPRLNYTAREMLAMPAAERRRIAEAQAELAAPEYERDLLLPPRERELTAFMVLNDVERVYDRETP
ncbi:MAG: hypothetical protein H8F28_09890 [Fibrella sp.]|nr:hypothetical protein [Armatimonadota bacterium]